VQLIFQLYDRGYTLRQIADELYTRGLQSPKGGTRWQRYGILKILTNVNYTGDWVWGEQSPGKRYRQHKGGIRERTFGEKRFSRNAIADCVIVPATHEALVPQEQFARVQARLKNAARRKGKKPGSCGGFVLSKLLVCGHCHNLVTGYTEKGRRMYCCSGYTAFGPAYCHKNSQAEKPIVDYVVAHLQKTLLNPEHLAELRAAALEAEIGLRDEDTLKRAREQIIRLDERLRRGNDRLLEVPRDRVPGLVESIRALEKERDDLQERIRQAEKVSPVAETEHMLAEVEAALWGMQTALTEEDWISLREVLRQMVTKIVLYFEHKQAGSRTRSRLLRGVVYRTLDDKLDYIFVNTSTTDCRRSRR
jgi:hypothetical protein